MTVHPHSDRQPRRRGEAAYAVACSESPDVIVLDLMLPDVDGFEVCRRLRSNKTTASIPVDHSLFRAMVSPEFLSVFAILKKPAIGDQLLAAITAAAQRT